jgi:hypothetical protein
METITEQDAYFLVALNASEESSVVELKWDFEKWDYGSIDVGKIIRSLISDGTILMSEREGDSYKDYSITESCEIAKKWSERESLNTIIFLTEAGESRWKSDDWGITSERAKYLMFSKQGSDSRVQ